MSILTRLVYPALAASLVSAVPAAADNALASWSPPSYPFAQNGSTAWAEEVEAATNGEIKIEVFNGAALMPALSTAQGVADGVAQVGLVAASYQPSQFPVSNAIDALGYKYPDPFVQIFAFSDFIMNEKVGYDDWRNNGVIFGGAYSTPNYYFLCRENYATLDDLKGKRIRTPGGGWSRFATDIGMVPVNLPGTEIYPSMERGAVDCVCGEPSILDSYKLNEVAKHVIEMNLAPGYSGALWAYNVDFWKGLTDDQRRALFNASASQMVEMEINFAAQVDTALDNARANGITVVKPDPTLQAAYDAWVADGIGGAAQIAKDQYGIADPEALFASYEAYVLKWQDLLAPLDRTDAEAMKAVVRENLFDKIDVTTYGME